MVIIIIKIRVTKEISRKTCCTMRIWSLWTNIYNGALQSVTQITFDMLCKIHFMPFKYLYSRNGVGGFFEVENEYIAFNFSNYIYLENNEFIANNKSLIGNTWIRVKYIKTKISISYFKHQDIFNVIKLN